MGYGLWLIGAVMVFNGMAIERNAESAMHQIYSGEYIVGGLLVAAIGCVVNALNANRRKLEEMNASLKKPDAAPAEEPRVMYR